MYTIICYSALVNVSFTHTKMLISKLIMVKTNFTHSDSLMQSVKIACIRTIKLDSLCLFCMCPRESFMSLLNLVK